VINRTFLKLDYKDLATESINKKAVTLASVVKINMFSVAQRVFKTGTFLLPNENKLLLIVYNEIWSALERQLIMNLNMNANYHRLGSSRFIFYSTMQKCKRKRPEKERHTELS